MSEAEWKCDWCGEVFAEHFEECPACGYSVLVPLTEGQNGGDIEDSQPAEGDNQNEGLVDRVRSLFEGDD